MKLLNYFQYYSIDEIIMIDKVTERERERDITVRMDPINQLYLLSSKVRIVSKL